MLQQTIDDYRGSDPNNSARPPLSCGECDRTLDTKSKFEYHKRVHNPNSDFSEYDCHLCGSPFDEYPSKRSDEPGGKGWYCSVQCSNSDVELGGLWTACAECGADELYIPPSRVDSMGDYPIDNHFCNKECEGDWKRRNWVGENHPSYAGGDVDVVCEECGGSYGVKPCLVDHTRFCSKECKRIGLTVDEIDLICPMCGDGFSKKPYNIKGGDTLCSDDCFKEFMSTIRKGELNPAWGGGKAEYYGPNWRKQRQKTLCRDGHICQLCSMSASGHYDAYGRDLNVHHIVRFKSFDSHIDANALTNLITVCHGCHVALEQKDETTQRDMISAADVMSEAAG